MCIRSKEIAGFIIYLLIISATVNPIAATAAIGGTDQTAPGGNGTKIIGIDAAAFPKITVNIFVDKICAGYRDLKRDDFRIAEDKNDTAIGNFHFTGNSSGHKLDLAIVFDETGTMDNEINALKSKIRELTEKINASRLDARYSLVTFNGTDVITQSNWTDDAGSFRKAVGKLTTSGGSSDLPENSLDGIERVLSLGFRPDAQKIIVLATDEPSQQKGDGKSHSAYTMADVKRDILGSGAMLIAVSPDFRSIYVDPNVPRSDLARYADMRPLANESAGLWININKADFAEILSQIQGILTGTYIIDYTSPDLTPAENRTVSVYVDAPGCLKGMASATYVSPANAPESIPKSVPKGNVPPVITSLAPSKPSPQQAGSVVLWTANATDEDGDLILYRFFLNGIAATEWQLSNQWPWNTTEGAFRMEVRARDGLHAGPNAADDARSESYRITASNASEKIPAIAVAAEKPPAGSWMKTFGGAKDDIGSDVQVSSDGGYVITGHTSSYGVGGMDIWLIKTDSAGKEIWSRAFGGDGNEFATSIQKTDDGGYVITGITSSFGAGEKDLWLIKTDAQGREEWDKTFGGSWDDGGFSVQQTADGGYIATGATGSMGPSTIWLVKTDRLGDEEWERTLDLQEDVGQISTGSFVEQAGDGGYIVAGDSSKGSIILIKTDSQGGKQWEKIFGGSAIDRTTVSVNSRVLLTTDGGYLIEGSKSSEGSEGMDLWLIKTDFAGNVIWSRTYGGEGDDYGTSVQQAADGGYIIVGHTSSSGDGGADLWLFKTDSAGNVIWSRTFGGKEGDYGTAVQQTADGGYIVTGRTSSYGAGGVDMWLIRTDGNGNVEGAALKDGPGSKEGAGGEKSLEWAKPL
ncbi:MAG: VWA domain-containing protein, partial [Methanothrix sp.]|nr:VWA domain-containing protein [Methanothrix sp.]